MTDIDDRTRPPQQQQQQPPKQQQQQQQQHSQELQSLREDLREKSNRLEAALAEKNPLSRKLKSLEQRDTTDHSKKVKQALCCSVLSYVMIYFIVNQITLLK